MYDYWSGIARSRAGDPPGHRAGVSSTLAVDRQHVDVTRRIGALTPDERVGPDHRYRRNDPAVVCHDVDRTP
jgi:hypothetical protein